MVFLRMDKNDKQFWIIVGMMGLIILLLTLLLVYLPEEGMACLSDPITYGENYHNISCKCYEGIPSFDINSIQDQAFKNSS